MARSLRDEAIQLSIAAPKLDCFAVRDSA